MIPVIGNTLHTLDKDILIKVDQMMLKLDIEGKFYGKDLALIFFIKKLVNDPNVSDTDKVRLNYRLINIKNTKIY